MKFAILVIIFVFIYKIFFKETRRDNIAHEEIMLQCKSCKVFTLEQDIKNGQCKECYNDNHRS